MSAREQTLMNIDTTCPHERDRKLPAHMTYPDHKPLTFAGLKMLLKAATMANCQDRARIQVRLTQAIPGMTCPVPTKGVVAQSMSRLDALYVRTPKDDLPKQALEFWAIIIGRRN